MIPTSVQILRERGPMNLRRLTEATAAEFLCVLLYEDVDAVMRRAERESMVRVACSSRDIRNVIWEAI